MERRLVDKRLGLRLERRSRARVLSARGRSDRRSVGAGGAAVSEAGRGDGTGASSSQAVVGAGMARARLATGRRRAGVADVGRGGGGGVQLLLATLLLAVTHALGVGVGDLVADGLKERVELAVEILLDNAEVPFEKEEELLLHEVDLGAVEAESVHLGGDVSVVGPVLVLGRRIVEVLGSEDERSQEDAVGGASETASHGLKLGLESGEVDEGRHESRDLDVGGDDELSDELFDSGEAAVGGLDGPGLGALGRCGRKFLLSGGVLLRRHEGGVAADDVVGGVGEVGDHFAADGLVDKLLEGELVELIHGEHSRRGSHDVSGCEVVDVYI